MFAASDVVDGHTPVSLPTEERPARKDETYQALLGRLSRQSVAKHFDAYTDVPWDHPSCSIDPKDPQWELPATDPLGATSWYRSQPAAVRARIGLHVTASFLKVGAQFENILKRGLLEYALALPDGSAEFRYAYHEVIEEAQHSLMFREFVNRTGMHVEGMRWVGPRGRRVVRFARVFPEIFFLSVIAGEEPIDYVQRRALQTGQPAHPLLRRITQIHVTEEARHLCFARRLLKERVPRLSRLRRWWLTYRAPLTFAIVVHSMLRPPKSLIREYGIPADVVAEAYGMAGMYGRLVAGAVRKARALCMELGLTSRRADRVWRWFGLVEETVG
jgi:hypothetical protein